MSRRTQVYIAVPDFSELDGLNFLHFYAELSSRFPDAIYLHLNENADFSQFLRKAFTGHSHEIVVDVCAGYGWTSRVIRESYRLMQHVRTLGENIHILFPDYEVIYYHSLYIRDLGLLPGQRRMDVYTTGSDISRCLMSLNVVDDQELIIAEELRNRSISLADTLYHVAFLSDASTKSHSCVVPFKSPRKNKENSERKLTFFFPAKDASRTKVLLHSHDTWSKSSWEIEVYILGTPDPESIPAELHVMAGVKCLTTVESIVDTLDIFRSFGRVCILDGGLLPFLYDRVGHLADEVFVEKPLFHAGFLPSDMGDVFTFNVSPREIDFLLTSLPACRSEEDAYSFNLRTDLKSVSKSEVCENQKSHAVTVCITHFQREDLLEEALLSLEQQTYRNFSVIVSDDGSNWEDTCNYLSELEKSNKFSFPIRVIRQKNAYLGASRNHGLSQAETEYILFMDDDNLARPYMLEQMLYVAEMHQSDFVGSVMSLFKERVEPDVLSEQRFIPVGNAGLSGLFRNNFSDAHGLYRVDSLRLLGGFTEHWGAGHEDWEIFFRMSLKGMRLDIHPDPLFDYRVAENSMVRDKTARARNMIRVLNPLLEAAMPAIAGQDALPVLLYAQGAWLRSVWSAMD